MFFIPLPLDHIALVAEEVPIARRSGDGRVGLTGPPVLASRVCEVVPGLGSPPKYRIDVTFSLEVPERRGVALETLSVRLVHIADRPQRAPARGRVARDPRGENVGDRDRGEQGDDRNDEDELRQRESLVPGADILQFQWELHFRREARPAREPARFSPGSCLEESTPLSGSRQLEQPPGNVVPTDCGYAASRRRAVRSANM